MSSTRKSRRKSKPLKRPMSDLAALILSCGEDRSVLLVLADWLEEKLGLEATAALLRQPRLQVVSGEPHTLGEFAYFAAG